MHPKEPLVELKVSVCGVGHRQIVHRRAMMGHPSIKDVHGAGFGSFAGA